MLLSIWELCPMWQLVLTFFDCNKFMSFRIFKSSFFLIPCIHQHKECITTWMTSKVCLISNLFQYGNSQNILILYQLCLNSKTKKSLVPFQIWGVAINWQCLDLFAWQRTGNIIIWFFSYFMNIWWANLSIVMV